MKILIDDERNTLPDGSIPDIIIRNFGAAMLFWMLWDEWSWENLELYVDHDLGNPEDGSGYDFLANIEATMASPDTKPIQLPAKIVVVSANIPGAERMEACVKSIYKMAGRVNES